MASSTTYVDLERFTELTSVPSADIDVVEAKTEGWTENQCLVASRQIDAKLNKRYATPFTAPVPLVVEMWIVRIVQAKLYFKRGQNPGDEQQKLLNDDALAVWTELKDAADGNSGLTELPLRDDDPTVGVARGGPLGYSERSPYAWRDIQSEAGRIDDSG